MGNLREKAELAWIDMNNLMSINYEMNLLDKELYKDIFIAGYIAACNSKKPK